MQLTSVINLLILPAQIKNASKVLRAILGVLHQSFTSGSGFSNPESAEEAITKALGIVLVLLYDYAESTFDELLQRPELRGNEICDPKVGGCGKSNNLHCILSTRPHVFATVLLWKSNSEPVDDISATLRALSTEIDIGVIFEDLDPGNKYSLISMVCRYQQHYICFVYNHEHEKWILYDDEILQVMGGWDEVLIMCETGQLQPEILFFEAAE
ncbi:inactive ubiquitin carboxyl-terminal hydrolase 53-like [Camellia sinensis]|uniref:inactive ubiquitin carboxyl-terminal hydrolase 53-like n=1 Tax=Camellia sinensis TaxID=4442 RepID=UPI001036DD4C|nr:inactive ubiquitin carboxyl-terminal hydrolase 53-like [Camellia sinensis]